MKTGKQEKEAIRERKKQEALDKWVRNQMKHLKPVLSSTKKKPKK